MNLVAEDVQKSFFTEDYVEEILKMRAKAKKCDHPGRCLFNDKCDNWISNTECSKSCEIRACGNRRLDKPIANPGIKKTKCFRKGYRVISTKELYMGQFLCEYVGEVKLEAEYEAVCAKYPGMKSFALFFDETKDGQKRKKKNKDQSWVLDSTRFCNISRSFNHSCKPNTMIEPWISSNGFLRLILVAKKHIAPNQELCYDYNFSAFGSQMPWKCLCAQDNCMDKVQTKIGRPLKTPEINEGKHVQSAKRNGQRNHGENDKRKQTDNEDVRSGSGGIKGQPDIGKKEGRNPPVARSRLRTCTTCKTVFNDKSNFHRHLKTHIDEEPFVCDKINVIEDKEDKRRQVCGKKFNRHDSLLRHHRTHETRERKFACTQCGKKYLRKTHLNDHEYYQHGSPPKFICTEYAKNGKQKRCMKKFATKTGLSLHHQKWHY